MLVAIESVDMYCTCAQSSHRCLLFAFVNTSTYSLGKKRL